VGDFGLSSNPVDRKHDPVRDAVRLDPGLTALAVKGECHGEDGLQRIALCAPGRRYVGFAARHPRRIIQDILDGPGRQSGPVVRDDDLVVGDLDADHGRRPGLLAGIDRVVEEFLEHYERPLFDLVTGLVDQFFRRGKLGEPTRLERGALERGP
jgi:hypothetical protein